MNKQSVITILLALIGIVSMSSAVVAFSYIDSVGPITKSSWRLQITSFCFCISVFFRLRKNYSTYLSKLQEYYKQIIVSGISIGGHFILWNISMQYTSVAHSLLFLYSCPILLVFYYFAIKKSLKKLQIFGAFLGFAGLSLMCFMSNTSEGTTWYGDLISLSGALALCANLILSEAPMADIPIMYLFAIHLIAAIFCSILSAIVEPEDSSNLLAFLYEFQGVYAVYLGVVCGFIGNGAFYLLLKRVNPFVVSVIINFDPIVGSLFAWVFGFLNNPGYFTYIGGALVVFGNLIATASGQDNKEIKDENSSPVDSCELSSNPQIKPVNAADGLHETSQVN